MPPRQRRFAAPAGAPKAGAPKGPIPRAAAIRDLIAAGGESYSFEFMPPKTDAEEQQLWKAIRQLEPLRPTFVSVTYGAGGSTRARTVRVTGRIPEGSPHGRQPLRGRAAPGHRLLRRGRRPQPAGPARRPAGRPQRRMGPPPAGAQPRRRAGPADPVLRRLLCRGGRVPRAAPTLAWPGLRRGVLRGQVPGRG